MKIIQSSSIQLGKTKAFTHDFHCICWSCYWSNCQKRRVKEREISYFFKHCYKVFNSNLIIFLCQQVFIMFSIIVSLLFEVLALSLFKGMHLVYLAPFSYESFVQHTVSLFLWYYFTLFGIFCFFLSWLICFFFLFLPTFGCSFFYFLFFGFLLHFPFNEISFIFP